MIINKRSVAILTATYNGEKYISEQIQSLVEQGSQSWTLYIHDDGSSDRTLDIVKSYAEKYPNIELVDDEMKGLGCRENFLHLLRIVESKYYMFCDQDDIWFPDMITIFENRLSEIDDTIKNNHPILLHSDFSMVDKDLKVIHPSRWASYNFKPQLYYDPHLICIASPVRGANMLINKASKDIIMAQPSVKMMYDTWISYVLSKNECKFYTIFQPTNAYRIHEGNLEGSRLLSSRGIKERIKGNFKLCSIIKEVDESLNFFKYIYYRLKIIALRYKN